MKQYNINLSPNLVNLGTEGSLDSSVTNGNSLQRTVNGISVTDENHNTKIVGRLNDGQIFDDSINSIPENTNQNFTDWERPEEWLKLPEIEGVDKFVGLIAIYPDANFIAFKVEGNYTVDWGDGTVTNHNSGSNAEKQYNYEEIAKIGESSLEYRQAIIQITPQPGNDIISIDLQVKHSHPNLPSYNNPWLEIAINAPKMTSLTVSGGYTPLIHTNSLAAFTLYANSLTNTSHMFAFCYSLISVKCYNLSKVTDMNEMFLNCHSLKHILFLNTDNVLDTSYMFSDCYSLNPIPLFETKHVTNMEGMFTYCNAILTIPLFDTRNVTNMSYMFEGCFALESVYVNAENATNLSYMFSECHTLTDVKLDNTNSVTDMSGLFSYCNSLRKVPLFDTSSVTNMDAMFYICLSLTEVPLFDTQNVTSMQSMFNYCSSLKTVPHFNTANVTDMSYMFYECSALTWIPLFDTSNVTNMSHMFSECEALNWVPLLDVRKVTNTSNMFSTCGNLSMGSLYRTRVNTSYLDCKLSGEKLNEIYSNLAGLGTKTVSGATGDGAVVTYTTSTNHHYLEGQLITVAGLSPSGFNVTDVEIIDVSAANQFVVAASIAGTSTGTGTANGGSTATLVTSGNWGLGDDNPNIATDKGWIVVE